MRLHLALGSLAAASLREVFEGDLVAVCRDPFTEGRCRFDEPLSRREWLRRRKAWWLRTASEVEDHRPQPAHGGDPADEEAPDEDEALARALDRAQEFDSCVLWAADDLDEQLFACWSANELLAYLPALPVWHARPSPKGSRYADVGQRSDDLRSVEARQLAESVRDAAAIWDAFVRASPDAFFALVTAAGCPAMADRLVHLLPRFPDRKDGLTIWERRILRAFDEHAGEATARTAVRVFGVGHHETPDGIGDATVFELMVELAGTGLLAMSGDGRAMHSTRFALTDLGRDVLEGRINRVAHVGFDRWIGGTHLDATTGALWWFADGALEWAPVPDR